MIELSQNILDQIVHHAEDEYPNECCGMILGSVDNEGRQLRVRPCQNVQDIWHAKDPDEFPKTAQNGFFIDPSELFTIQREIRASKERIKLIYHSHPDAKAYFSEEDQRIALMDGRPAYPGVDYLVISVIRGKAKEYGYHWWDEQKKKFIYETRTIKPT